MRCLRSPPQRRSLAGQSLNLPARIRKAFADDHLMPDRTQVGVPVLLRWPYIAAVGCFHFNPQPPLRHAQIRYAWADALGFQPTACPARAGFAVRNGEDPDTAMRLAEPFYELALFDVFRTFGS